MEKIRVIWVGVGGRGYGLMKMVLDNIPYVDIVGVSDLYEDRTERGRVLVKEKRGYEPFASTNHLEVMERVEADAVVTPSSWESHAQVLVDAMEHGMYAATEVGGATSLDDCWRLVRTSERTGKPCMMLENCCYDRFEMTLLRMVREGLFGELVHAEGGYRHDLRGEISGGHINRHYRLDNYKNRNGDLYPTHALGPIAKTLEINRGNRMTSLVSVASKARGLNEMIRTERGADFENADFPFAEGDVVTTIISCAHGETITLTHDTSLPRPYSRGYLLQGTKGIASEDRNFSVCIPGLTPPATEGWDPHAWTPMAELYEKYEHPLWAAYRNIGVKSGHGGMDYLVFSAFFEAVREQKQTPIDVYDTAAWMAITPLSEASVACGGAPQAIPDFTNGAWIHRKPSPRGKFNVDIVCDEAFENLNEI